MHIKKGLSYFIKIFSITILFIFIVSCNELVDAGDSKDTVDNTAYASECELDQYAEAGFVNYKVARYYALGALENFQDDPVFKNGRLSKFPVIIYNSQTNLPRYYEFKVLNNKIPVAGITCVATKGEGLPCVSLRCGKSSLSKAFHYRTILGLKTEKVKTILKVLWYKKTLLSWEDHFYWMHDNGADGENFYENANKLYEIDACRLVKIH